MFEIVAMYYVNLFINQLYGIARKHKAAKGGDMSLTDMYKEVVMAYVYGAQHEENHFRSVVNDLHRMFAQTPKFASIGIAQFVDSIIEFFIPPNYLVNFTAKDRTELFQKIIISTFLEFQNIVLNTARIGCIIDNRSEKAARQFQDDIVDLLVMQRDTFFNGFMAQIGQSSDVINVRRQDYDNMRGTIVTLIRQKHELEEQMEAAGLKIKKSKSVVSTRSKKSKSSRNNQHAGSHAGSHAGTHAGSHAGTHGTGTMGGKLAPMRQSSSVATRRQPASDLMNSIHETQEDVDASIHADDSVSNVGGYKAPVVAISGFNPGASAGANIFGNAYTAHSSVTDSTIDSSYFSDEDESTALTNGDTLSMLQA
jgi:hypothetical protein